MMLWLVQFHLLNNSTHIILLLSEKLVSCRFWQKLHQLLVNSTKGKKEAKTNSKNPFAVSLFNSLCLSWWVEEEFDNLQNRLGHCLLIIKIEMADEDLVNFVSNSVIRTTPNSDV